MRLLNVKSLRLESFFNPENTPPYAILSHAWEDEEVLFDDIEPTNQNAHMQALQDKLRALESYIPHLGRTALPPERTVLDQVKRKKGWPKVIGCCQEAAKFGFGYVWIDTCCINKSDSSELSEAINSMFAWYRDAEVCFAYLSDVSSIDEAIGRKISTGPPKSSRWFSRGWTLQELVAPSELIFYERNWNALGSRKFLAERIHITTRIPQSVLRNGIRDQGFLNFGAAAKMSWAAHRQTTRPEDQAYSLMGLFSVNMPTLYGEGETSAFFRLQTEIFRASGDLTIFSWCKDQFRIEAHPEGTRHSFRYYISDWERVGAGLFAPTCKFFAPGPRFQDLPLNVTSRDDVPGVDITSLPSYPTIEGKPYDLKSLVGKGSDASSGKYSAFSHAMRVQMLLEHVRKIEPENEQPSANIFIAHLGCKLQSSAEIVGIYLISDKPGQYRRVYPSALLAIDPIYHAQCNLVLEDIYVTQTDPVLYSRHPPDDDMRVYGFNGLFSVRILQDELLRAGYKILETSPCKKSSNNKEHLLIFEDDSWWKDDQTKRHILVFEGIETPSGAANPKHRVVIIWEIHNGAFQIDAEVDDIGETRMVDSQNVSSRYPPWPLEVYKLSNKTQFHYSKRSRAGRGVILSIRQSEGKIHLNVVLYPHPLASPATLGLAAYYPFGKDSE